MSNQLLADAHLKRDAIIRPRGRSRDGLQDVLELKSGDTSDGLSFSALLPALAVVRALESL
ncbi:hypothetical protein M407DRAFT_19736 [Tulasnella calospora MUT 4182]|uniref:Uncharacterized protein n=1 Tax=Tulasnella calospora MUT 4182 TaxID=1051891 RepID=A0A0C3QTA5_9AGAM|nr:hypothetical protein M407DRAFT_19736 [Tulasnella calospora MUT 4182]